MALVIEAQWSNRLNISAVCMRDVIVPYPFWRPFALEKLGLVNECCGQLMAVSVTRQADKTHESKSYCGHRQTHIIQIILRYDPYSQMAAVVTMPTSPKSDEILRVIVNDCAGSCGQVNTSLLQAPCCYESSSSSQLCLSSLRKLLPVQDLEPPFLHCLKKRDPCKL